MSNRHKLFSKEELKKLEAGRNSSHSMKEPLHSRMHELLYSLPGFRNNQRFQEPVRVDVDGRGKYYYDALRDHIFHTSNGELNIPHLIAVTSCLRREGKTTVAINLAITLARHGDGSVLLVDMNEKNAEIHKVLKVKRSPGLKEFIWSNEEYESVIQPTKEALLSAVAAGKTRSSSYLFETDEFADFIRRVRIDYDFVIFDVASMREGDDAPKLGQFIDGIIMVVESENTRWQVVKRAANRLEQFNASILGIVLNKRKFHIPRWIYDKL